MRDKSMHHTKKGPGRKHSNGPGTGGHKCLKIGGQRWTGKSSNAKRNFVYNADVKALRRAGY